MIGNIESIINGVRDKINQEKGKLESIWEGQTADAFISSLSKNDKIFTNISEQLSSFSLALADIKELEEKLKDKKSLQLSLGSATAEEEKQSYQNQINSINSEIETLKGKIIKDLSNVTLLSSIYEPGAIVNLAVSKGYMEPGDQLTPEVLSNPEIQNAIGGSSYSNYEGLLSDTLSDMANYFIKSVGMYSGASYVRDKAFSEMPIRKDCTGFAVAYMSRISGTNLPESHSAAMVDPNGEWAKKAEASGWKAYTTDEISELKTGDVLVANPKISYSLNHHAEIYVDETHTFGWGSVKKSFPTNNAVKKREKNGHIVYSDWIGKSYQHDYVTVYRYEG